MGNYAGSRCGTICARGLRPQTDEQRALIFRKISGVLSIPELLNGHITTLEVECLDRLYLNGYIGRLATAGGPVTFAGPRHRTSRSPSRRESHPGGRVRDSLLCRGDAALGGAATLVRVRLHQFANRLPNAAIPVGIRRRDPSVLGRRGMSSAAGGAAPTLANARLQLHDIRPYAPRQYAPAAARLELFDFHRGCAALIRARNERATA